MVSKVIITERKGSSKIDALDHLSIMDIEHYKVHEQKHYFVTDVDESIAIAGPKYWHFSTCDNTLIHFNFRIDSSKNSLLEVFHNPILTEPGTELSILNSNFNSNNVSEAKFYYGPSVTADGTRIFVQVLGDDSTARPNVSGGDYTRAHEWVLRRNKSYLIKLTALNNDTRASIELQFYEQ